MKAVLISDLHLEESRPDITEAFLTFCKTRLENASQFFILGDLFEVWVGDDYETDFIREIKNTLKNVSAGIENCFFQHGNRDFLIGQEFAKETGFKLLADDYSFHFNQQSILLMHGDSLCTLDTEYMQARMLFRSEGFQQNVLSRPLEERLLLAQQLRNTSKNANAEKSMEIMDVTPEEVCKVMEDRKIDVLIHGHTHRPMIHDVPLNHNPNAKRFVMSDWENTIQYVEISDIGIELKTFVKD